MRPAPGRARPRASAAQASAEAPAASVPVAATEPAPAALRANALQAGVFDEEQANALRRVGWCAAPGQLEMAAHHHPGRWMVYMGKFADADALAKAR